MKRLILALLCGFVFGEANAQTPVLTIPHAITTSGGNKSNTITTTNTFQQVFAASPTSPGSNVRKGCTILNEGSHVMYVEEGAGLANATTANSIQLQPGIAYYCSNGVVSLTGEVDIAGTSGDAYYAAQY